MTPEQKKKVPRHLRGAGKVRFWCKYCDSYHGFPISLCKKYPGRKEMKKNVSEGMRRARNRELAEDDKLRNRLREANRKRWSNPEERKKAAENIRKINKKRAKAGKLSGKNNPMYGKRHSLQTRLRLSQAATEKGNILTEKDVERKIDTPAFVQDHGFRFPAAIGERDEFSVGQVTDAYDDEFDPFR